MVETNKEYFFSPYYFFISEKHDKISLYYSIAETLTESRKNDDKLDFDKKDLDKVKKGVSNILKDKKIKTKSNIKKYFDKLNKGKEEIEELVDSDGTLVSSRIPPLNMGLAPKKTTDQTVVMGRMTNNPVTRGYRKYYGESEESEDNEYRDIVEVLTKEDASALELKFYPIIPNVINVLVAEFAKELSKQLNKSGLNYVTDSTGVYTDSAEFVSVISECTNISVGYRSEHTFNESQDISHLHKLSLACLKVDWESLPTKRDTSRQETSYDWEYDSRGTRRVQHGQV